MTLHCRDGAKKFEHALAPLPGGFGVHVVTNTDRNPELAPLDVLRHEASVRCRSISCVVFTLDHECWSLHASEIKCGVVWFADDLCGRTTKESRPIVDAVTC